MIEKLQHCSQIASKRIFNSWDREDASQSALLFALEHNLDGPKGRIVIAMRNHIIDKWRIGRKHAPKGEMLFDHADFDLNIMLFESMSNLTDEERWIFVLANMYSKQQIRNATKIQWEFLDSILNVINEKLAESSPVEVCVKQKRKSGAVERCVKQKAEKLFKKLKKVMEVHNV